MLPTPNEIERIARMARAILEPIWCRWHLLDSGTVPPIPSLNTCGRSSLFLERALRDGGIDASVCRGVPQDGLELGFFDGASWRAHSWVEAEGRIIDITADQFGAPPVVILPRPERRYRGGGRDTAAPEAIARRRRLVDEIWPLWLALASTKGRS